MTFWLPPYQNQENWTTWEHSLSQHEQLLHVGGQVCKVLFRNLTGNSVGTPQSPIPITIWESDTTNNQPRKRIWKVGDAEANYPNIESVMVWIDGIPLTQTYSYETMTVDTEFYIEVQNNLVDYVNNVSIYLNSGYNVSGHTITYAYTTRSSSVDQYNLQTQDNADSFRTEYGYTQYLNSTSKFRGKLFPNTLIVSFPVPPSLDTKFSSFGGAEEWQNKAWALGDTKLHEFDILYRVSDGRYFELKDIEYNTMMYKNEWKLFTQAFTVAQIMPNDVAKNFILI